MYQKAKVSLLYQMSCQEEEDEQQSTSAWFSRCVAGKKHQKLSSQQGKQQNLVKGSLIQTKARKLFSQQRNPWKLPGKMSSQQGNPRKASYDLAAARLVKTLLRP